MFEIRFHLIWFGFWGDFDSILQTQHVVRIVLIILELEDDEFKCQRTVETVAWHLF